MGAKAPQTLGGIMDAKQIVEMLVGLVHELYPDEEYVELYGIEEKLALANKFLEESK